MDRFLLVFLGGGLGSTLRFGVGLISQKAFGGGFPLGTLIVNLTGCFAMGFFMQLVAGGAGFSPALRLALTTGFLGGLTTYSSFNYETTRLFENGARIASLSNVAATLFGCGLAGFLGSVLGRRLAG
jgi:CrcB protein